MLPMLLQATLFAPGDHNRTCFRIPVLVAARTTLFAFAESRSGPSCLHDGCVPLHPVLGDNRTAIVFRKSLDSGATWSGLTDICPDGHGEKGCSDFAVVFDEVHERLVVQYTGGDLIQTDSGACALYSPQCPFSTWQLRSSDMGQTWSAPSPLAPALGAADGAMPGPGRALQLTAGPKAGRLLFCGHKETNLTLGVYSSYQSPIWTSDDGGNSYTLRTTFPRADVDPFPRFGPHEGNLIELPGPGRVLYEARNNYWVYCSGSTHTCGGALN
jgi:hypothetical protein